MSKAFDVVALGELLIDFTENGTSKQGNPVLEANPGGAPCNVLAMLKKLSHKVAFIGKVGNDMFGNQLEEVLAETGIDTTGLFKDSGVNTTLAFVHTAPDGDRDFSFYRNPGADMMLSEADVEASESLLQTCKIFHFGTLSMTADGCRRATKKAIRIARDAGAIISFDPNLREPLWDSMDEAKEQVLYGLSQCDILKISDNEIVWLAGEEDYEKAALILQDSYNIPLILISLGRDGSLAFAGEKRAKAEAFIQETTIETTGAGDTFCAGILHHVLEKGWRTYSEEELEEMLKFANAGAALITTKKGALRVMPEYEDILRLVKK